MPRLVFMLSLFASLSARAHEGHGIDGASHYHATDVWGFVATVAMMLLLWWFTGKGK